MSIDPLILDPSTEKKYVLTFANGQTVDMVCYNGNLPLHEVAKWKNRDLSPKKIVSINEVEKFV